MDKLLVKLLDNVVTKSRHLQREKKKNLVISDCPINAIQFVIKVTCQNNCFSLNIYSYIWRVFNGHHLHGKWQEIREKDKCLWTDRRCIPSPTACGQTDAASPALLPVDRQMLHPQPYWLLDFSAIIRLSAHSWLFYCFQKREANHRSWSHHGQKSAEKASQTLAACSQELVGHTCSPLPALSPALTIDRSKLF